MKVNRQKRDDELLEEILEENQIPRSLFDKLLDIEKSKVHLDRRKTVRESIRRSVEAAIGRDEVE